MKALRYLDLSRNHLSGNLPDCNWGNLDSLSVAILSSNQLSGAIPNSIGGGAYGSLEWLQLNNNSLTGQLPSNLRNCTTLFVLDVGDNKLTGKSPEWIGNYMLYLAVLRLRNNEFYGHIPSAYCQLSGLQIMDFAHNQLTGNIPHCFGSLLGMITSGGIPGEFSFNILSNRRKTR
ncbi:receptor-like protein kinase bri1-like 3 [Phtheirospermum japonicum]|uniref:Receptor-like protein kinase bri1-like 3 n=1 Tax=Phtheirospermum japonicum TaxID=374723 RepID=A0A830C4H4_9LAMI|nr:receptor-like protein kinase bri1-like 3 [Phtheirospermum japonicum]